MDLVHERVLDRVEIFAGQREQHTAVSAMFREYIESLKSSMTVGDHSMVPDKNRIDSDIWRKCRILSDKGFVIGGSVILKLYGLIDREVGDIDVFLSTEEIDFDVKIHEEVVETEDSHGYSENDNRVKIEVDGIGIMDVFNKKQDFYIYDGIRINSPFSAIKAKISYSREKDVRDFISIVQNIKNH